MIDTISAKDKLSIVALARMISGQHAADDISRLAKTLEVPLTSEWRNRKTVVERLTVPIVPICNSLEQEQQISVARNLIANLMERSSATQVNEERNTYSPWFKQLIVKLMDEGASYKTIRQLTGISEDCLPKFRKDISLSLIKGPISDDHKLISQAWHSAKPKQRKTLERFWNFFGRNYRDTMISYDRVAIVLMELGLRYPRSKKSKDYGAQVKKEFCPNAIWEGDGKEITIYINEARYSFCWYAFVDQNTTLIVGSNVGRTESSSLFLSALKDAHQKRGVLAYGILLDNRLGEHDLSPVQDFCREHGISIVRTFPGNSKSNGMIENNFSIFEKFVGEIRIHGTNPHELAASVVRNVLEIFTQQRNHTRRRRFGDYSPFDLTTSDRPPEYIRSEVEKLAMRMAVNALGAELRWDKIRPARQHFGDLSEKSIAKIMRQLVKYTIEDIQLAQTKYLAQVDKYPAKTYGVEYFMAIVRHSREEQAKRTANEVYRASMESMIDFDAQNYRPFSELRDEILEVFEEVTEMKTPGERMARLDALCFWFAQYSVTHSVPQLWTAVSQAAEKSLLLSLNSWLEIQDYLARRIGRLLTIEKQVGRDHSS